MSATPIPAMGAIAIEAISGYFEKAIRYEKAVLKDKDPENLHQMRVNMRRLQTALQVFAPAITLPETAQEADVAKITHRLGALRDLDVTTTLLAEQYLPDLPETEGKVLKRVLKNLGKGRQRAYKRVKTTLKGDSYQALKQSFALWSETPVYRITASQPFTTVLPDLVLPLLSQLWLHPGWLVATHRVGNQLQPLESLEPIVIDYWVEDAGLALHSLRKQVKRVRYQLNLLSHHYGDRLQTDLARLQSLQEILGQLQDGWVLGDFLTKSVPQWETTLPTLKALLIDSRHRAWHQWQPLQQYYLDPVHRDALRHILLVPGIEAPVAATSSATKPAVTKSSPTETAPKATDSPKSPESSTAAEPEKKTPRRTSTKRTTSRSRSRTTQKPKDTEG
ncbi:CHAD domain-containing protein [Leptolyngbya sp. PCC 6406]|uniref:CHAD domain-containing protein n=1 Tax=Leptolyngbya sp. PCC 6406 TaxID=1173264 RepID=UPI0002AC8646|nr:CHAD domain-containing protein [Leptolyngbya sp. PCC 6406]